MGALRDTPFNNYYGEGKQQEYIADDGKKYIIRNISLSNFYGDGYQKEVLLDNRRIYIIRNVPFKNSYGEGYKQEVIDNNGRRYYTIEDTPFSNYYGEGKQLEVTDNSGQRYIIRNTFSHNFYGDGYQKEVVEQPSNYTSVSEGTDYSIIYGISFLLGFFTLCAFSTGGLNVISVMFLMSAVITLIIGIIKAPHTIITIVKIIIVTIIFGFIVMLPFLPGILECARF